MSGSLDSLVILSIVLACLSCDLTDFFNCLDITCNGNNDGTATAFIVNGNCGNTSNQTYCI